MFSMRNIPNFISFLRILLVPPVVFYLLEQNYMPALILFAIAGISDGIDGWLAKHFNWQSALGEILDPLADKLLLVSTYICFSWLELLPQWLVVSVILRDVVIIAGGVLYRVNFGKVEIKPSYVSKFNTLMQIVLIVVMLVSLVWFSIDELIMTVLIWTVLVTTIASGLMYVFSWGLRAVQAAKKSDS